MSRKIILEEIAYDTHFLLPSALYFKDKPTVVTTILGTCIAVCMYDIKQQIGGINHYMLPLWNGAGLASPKFGNIAIEKLIEKFEMQGSERKHLIAKVFGGKQNENMNENSILNIGERNIAVVREMLAQHRIRIAAESVGGPYGRKIIFNTLTGKVQMKYVAKETT